MGDELELIERMASNEAVSSDGGGDVRIDMPGGALAGGDDEDEDDEGDEDKKIDDDRGDVEKQEEEAEDARAPSAFPALRDVLAGLTAASGISRWSCLGLCCSPRRISLLLKFLIFHVVFILADIVTDFVGGFGLLSQGLQIHELALLAGC